MPLSDKPLPSSFDENEEFYNQSGLEKVWTKVKREPLVPLGTLLTVAAFCNAYRAMRKGDHQQVQRMFRARVAAQGFTVLAMVGGGIYLSEERQKERELWKMKQSQKEEEQRTRWIRELEARDAEEKELQERLARRRKAKEEGRKKTDDALEATSASTSASSTSAAWLGWPGGSKAADEPVATTAAGTTSETASSSPIPPTDGKKGTSTLGTLGSMFSKNSAIVDKIDEGEK